MFTPIFAYIRKNYDNDESVTKIAQLMAKPKFKQYFGPNPYKVEQCGEVH